MQSLNLIIFPEQTITQTKSMQTHAEPNWPYLFFLRYKPEFQEKIFEFSEKTQSSHFLFLQAVAREYGILTRRNLAQALNLYKEGAESNDAFCHFKLFYVYSQNCQKYHVQKNRDLAISHLVQAAAFWDPNRKNSDLLLHCNPKRILEVLLQKEDDKLVKIRLLIHKYFKGNPMKYNFLVNWIMVEFPFEEDLAEFHRGELEILVENSEYPEGCFYYGNQLVDEYNRDSDKSHEKFNKAEDLLMMAVKANVIKAHYSLSLLYEEASLNEESLRILRKGAKLGCCSCLDSLSYYYCIGLATPRDFVKATKYCFRSFIFGNLLAGHTFKDIGCYMKSVGLDSKMPEIDRKIFQISENLAEIQAEFNPTLHKVGADSYLLAKCYTDGINTNIDLKKALDIIDNALLNQDIDDKKYLIYQKGRILAKMGVDAKELLAESFNCYDVFLKNEKIKRYPQHYYRMGKFLEFGLGVNKNLNKAKEFYRKGIECIEEKANLGWIMFLYLQKCKKKIKQFEEEHKDF